MKNEITGEGGRVQANVLKRYKEKGEKRHRGKEIEVLLARKLS